MEKPNGLSDKGRSTRLENIKTSICGTDENHQQRKKDPKGGLQKLLDFCRWKLCKHTLALIQKLRA